MPKSELKASQIETEVKMDYVQHDTLVSAHVMTQLNSWNSEMGNKKDVEVTAASFMVTRKLQGDKTEQGVDTVSTPFLMYLPSPMLTVPNSTTSQLHGHKEENHKKTLDTSDLG